MNIYVYSDESGVFDKEHNRFFVFGGLILLGTAAKEEWSHRYSSAETILRKSGKYDHDYELKATHIDNSQKAKLFRSLNGCHKFGVIIEEQRVLERIYASKKDKQRYLDFAYKIALKRALQSLIDDHLIVPDEVQHLYVYCDEHTTATNGRYELQEALEQEFKSGTYNLQYDVYFDPLFTEISEVHMEYCDSRKKLLVRAADITANRIYYLVTSGQKDKIKEIKNMHCIVLPD